MVISVLSWAMFPFFLSSSFILGCLVYFSSFFFFSVVFSFVVSIFFYLFVYFFFSVDFCLTSFNFVASWFFSLLLFTSIFFHLFVCLCVYIFSIYLSIHLFICLSIYLCFSHSVVKHPHRLILQSHLHNTTQWPNRWKMTLTQCKQI